MGIEPTSEAWEASILPLYDARSISLILLNDCLLCTEIYGFDKSVPCEPLSSLGKSHGHGVHAIAQAGGLWPVFKDVAQVCVAKAAGNRRADHT
jgi:hypothetical protein